MLSHVYAIDWQTTAPHGFMDGIKMNDIQLFD